LPLAAREGADRLAGIANVDTHAAHLFARHALDHRPVHALERAPADQRLAPCEEIARDAHQRHSREVLVNGGDAAIQRIARRRELHRLISQADLPLSGTVHAGKDLDQRRLAGAVVAEQAMDLARLHREGHAVERDHRAEILADIAQLDQRRHQRVSCAFLRM
jgi:hypothetical protein